MEIIIGVIVCYIVLKIVLKLIPLLHRKLATKGLEKELYAECRAMGMTKERVDRILGLYSEEVCRYSDLLKSDPKCVGLDPIARMAIAVHKISDDVEQKTSAAID